jgi:hypothetical protein
MVIVYKTKSVWSERRGRALSTLVSYSGGPGFKTRHGNRLSWDFSWFFSVPPGEWWNNKVKLFLYRHETSRGRGGIASIHSWPQHYVGMSDQRHAPATLYPQGKNRGTHWLRGWVGLRAGLDRDQRKNPLSLPGSNADLPVCSQTLYWLMYYPKN